MPERFRNRPKPRGACAHARSCSVNGGGRESRVFSVYNSSHSHYKVTIYPVLLRDATQEVAFGRKRVGWKQNGTLLFYKWQTHKRVTAGGKNTPS